MVTARGLDPRCTIMRDCPTESWHCIPHSTQNLIFGADSDENPESNTQVRKSVKKIVAQYSLSRSQCNGGGAVNFASTSVCFFPDKICCTHPVPLYND